MKGKSSQRTGFTVVELLIVIVIVAVLAAVSIIAYTGIQERAQRASVLSRLNQWEKVFSLYMNERGKRPQGQWACIGRSSDYPEDDDFPAGSCAIYSTNGGSTWSPLYRVDSEGNLLSDQLEPYLSSRAVADHSVISLNGYRLEKWRGVIYDDYSNGHISFVYATPGDSCVTSSWYTRTYTNGRVCYYSIDRASNYPQWE